MIVFPQDEKLEAIVLGTLMSFPDAINEAGGMLNEEYFYKPFHKDVLGAIKALIRERKTVDILSVKQYIGDPKLAYDISNLCMNVVSRNITEKIHYLAEIHFKRKLLDLNFTAFTELNQGKDFFEMKDFVAKGLLDLQQEIEGVKGEKDFAKIVQEAEDKIDISMQNETGITGICTGNHVLDAMTGGWQKTDLIILAARPGMGKTARALSFLKTAVIGGAKALFMSLEMSGDQLVMRLLAEGSNLDLADIRRGRVSHYSREYIRTTAQYLKTLPITINDNGRTTIYDIASKCRILKSQNKLDVLFVDYLQIVRGSKADSRLNRNDLIGMFTSEFKAIAKECEIPVIVLAQLNRANDGSKRPDLQHLRESGSIEQDADFVGFIYRPSYYTKGDQSKETEEEFKEMSEHEYLQYSEFVIAKNRNGKLGVVREYFDGSKQKFSENYNSERVEDFSFVTTPF